jgi:spermidine synthase
MTASSPLVLLLFFIISGATSLVYEVLWTRQLSLTFGVTTYAVSTVLATFMGGLALGAPGLRNR